ncbi:Type IV secretion system protein virB9 precursor [Candidatus Arcanobacter lacustris]|jgi:type IV secretion system protein VirB9|uniref:Type IV secretion system protein virB9 n=1 Tax=Candidatus Arcanibacter lacustris TaxID=1607817 RepID=A0A0F5MRM5_9RICK|nr:Type IV secretion system protein virB9 precursor [Candidatus Arcanobacter lacustris]
MKYYLSIFLFLISISQVTYAEVPITTDNRIKTYIYNENEVFTILVHYGYQSSIELSYGEEVETISMGDSYAWKITPVGRRIFIKPFEENIHTNMTIITNKRTYQFDIVSKLPSENFDKELAYVVRFFYPEIKKSEKLDN